MYICKFLSYLPTVGTLLSASICRDAGSTLVVGSMGDFATEPVPADVKWQILASPLKSRCNGTYFNSIGYTDDLKQECLSLEDDEPNMLTLNYTLNTNACVMKLYALEGCPKGEEVAVHDGTTQGYFWCETIFPYFRSLDVVCSE